MTQTSMDPPRPRQHLHIQGALGEAQQCAKSGHRGCAQMRSADSTGLASSQLLHLVAAKLLNPLKAQLLLPRILPGLKHIAMLTIHALLMVIVHLWPGLSLVLAEPPRSSSSTASPTVLGLGGLGCHRRLAGTPLQHKGAAACCRSADDARDLVTGRLPASSSLQGSLPLLALTWLQHSAGAVRWCGPADLAEQQPVSDGTARP